MEFERCQPLGNEEQVYTWKKRFGRLPVRNQLSVSGSVDECTKNLTELKFFSCCFWLRKSILWFGSLYVVFASEWSFRVVLYRWWNRSFRVMCWCWNGYLSIDEMYSKYHTASNLNLVVPLLITLQLWTETFIFKSKLASFLQHFATKEKNCGWLRFLGCRKQNYLKILDLLN